jgi:ABC-type nitrate/sulfonate/bicarbonate transport system substrate-binding protein
MKKLHKAIITLAGAALASLVFASGAPAQDRVLKFGLPFPEVEYMPLYAAQQNGYFTDEKLKIEVFALSSGDKITLALASGSINIANYTPDWFVRAIEKGANIKIVAGSSNVPVYSLVGRSDINGYADLKGKRIAVSAVKASDAYLVRKMFSAHALKAGSVAATLLIPPYDSVIVAEGFKRLDVSTGTVTNYTWLSHAVLEDWAKANKETLVAFLRAWIKGTRWVYDPKNKDAAIKLLAKELKINESFARSAHEMYFESKTETVAKEAAIDLVGLQNLIDAIVEQGDILGAAPKAAKYIDSTYLQEALKTLN